MGVTIISVGLWRKAEQRGHGRGGHFAVVLWMTVLPAPLASSSHCPASAWSPGTRRSCSPSSSTSWSSCTVLPAVFVFGGLFVPLCICFIRGFDGVSGGSGSWYSRSSSSCRSSESGRSRGACEFRTVLGHLDSSQRSTSTCLAAVKHIARAGALLGPSTTYFARKPQCWLHRPFVCYCHGLKQQDRLPTILAESSMTVISKLCCAPLGFRS